MVEGWRYVTLVLHPSRNELGTVLQVGVEAHGALHLKSYGNGAMVIPHMYGAGLWAVAECRLYGVVIIRVR